MDTRLRNVFLVGDIPTKLLFLCEFLHENTAVLLKEQCEGFHSIMEMTHSVDCKEKVEIDKKNNTISILSGAFPSGIRMFVDFAENDWTYSKSVQNADLILFVERFPFTTDHLKMRLELIEKYLMNRSCSKTLEHIEFEVVFYHDKNQHFGVTDKIGIDEALKQAPEVLTDTLNKSANCSLPISTLIDFKVYEKVSDVFNIVFSNGRILNTLSTVGRGRFGQWKSLLEYFQEDYKDEYSYQFDSDLRCEMIHNSINKFSVVKNSDDIMKSYTKNYYEKCFGEVKRVAIDQYRQCISQICFWDIEKDVSVLDKILDKLCFKELTFKEQLACPKTQADYQKIITDKKIDIEFSNKVEKLEQIHVPNLVYDYLKKKEEILFKAFAV